MLMSELQMCRLLQNLSGAPDCLSLQCVLSQTETMRHCLTCSDLMLSFSTAAAHIPINEHLWRVENEEEEGARQRSNKQPLSVVEVTIQ